MRISRVCFYLIAGIICLHMLGPAALAAEEATSWRGSWDEVMLWLNFAILAFVLIKFGRSPIIDFLRGRRKEVAREIRQVEDEKEKVTSKISETFKVLEDSEVRFADLRQKIVDQGQKRKEAIIEEARRQSQIMLEGAKRKVDNQILRAKETFKAELVDMAVAAATEKLPVHVTEADDQQFFENYLTEALRQ